MRRKLGPVVEDIVDGEGAEIRWKAVRTAIVGNADGSTEGDGEGSAVCIVGFDGVVCAGSSVVRLAEVHIQSAIEGFGRHVDEWVLYVLGFQ